MIRYIRNLISHWQSFRDARALVRYAEDQA